MENEASTAGHEVLLERNSELEVVNAQLRETVAQLQTTNAELQKRLDTLVKRVTTRGGPGAQGSGLWHSSCCRN